MSSFVNLYNVMELSNSELSLFRNFVILIVFAISFYFYKNKQELKKNEDFYRKFRMGLVFIGLFYLSFDPLIEYMNTGMVIRKLPIQVCSLSTVIYLVAFYSKSGKWLQRSTIYLAYIGAIAAIIFPVTTNDMATLNFWVYYIGHICILVALSYSVIVEENIPVWQDVLKGSILIVAVGYCIMLPLNGVLGTNYFFIGEYSFETISYLQMFGSTWSAGYIPFTIAVVCGFGLFVYVTYLLEKNGIIDLEADSYANDAYM